MFYHEFIKYSNIAFLHVFCIYWKTRTIYKITLISNKISLGKPATKW